MGIKNYITDSKNNKTANIITHNDIGNNNAIVVASHPLKQYLENTIFFSNENSGINLAVEAGEVGEGETISLYNENVEWETSEIGTESRWQFDQENTAGIFPHSGSYMIDAINTNNNSTMQLLNSSNINLSLYYSITGWIYLTTWKQLGTKRIDFYGWDSSTDTQVGDIADIGNYIDIGLLKSWQKFTIPLSDLSLTGKNIDSFRIRTIDIGTGVPPNYYLDQIDMQASLEEGEPSIVFTIEPKVGTWMYIESFTFFFGDDDFSTILENSTMPNIPYDSLLGVGPLSNGLTYNRFYNDKIIVTEVINQLSDLIRLPATSISGNGGTRTPGGSWISITSP
ncbi:MAG: hypothetical protein KAH05_04565, partial [Clostridiales bacterium]|nr:hypothetical protein [Clostridiales bacterium]